MWDEGLGPETTFWPLRAVALLGGRPPEGPECEDTLRGPQGAVPKREARRRIRLSPSACLRGLPLGAAVAAGGEFEASCRPMPRGAAPAPGQVNRGRGRGGSTSVKISFRLEGGPNNRKAVPAVA
eukprot:11100706-Heterocapsa_arctica.AAC.1